MVLFSFFGLNILVILKMEFIMHKLIIVLISSLTLLGCANANYSEYLVVQQNIEVAKANAEVARYQAMAEIAKNGDTTTQVAAMMSLQSQAASESKSRGSNIVAPKSVSDEIKQWAALLVPGLTQITINGQNSRANMHNSDNNVVISTTNSNNSRETAIAQSNANAQIEIAQAEQTTIMAGQTADAFVSIAGEIQSAPSYTDSNNVYTDSSNSFADSNNADSYNDNSNNSDNSDNSNNSDNSTAGTAQ